MSLFSPLTLPWDLIIVVTILVGSILAMLAWRRSRKRGLPRWKRVVTRTLSLLIFMGVCTMIYGSFIEPQLIVVTRANVSIGLTEPLTVALISDLHVGPYKGARFVTRAVEKINALHPDVVLIAGDFVLDEEVTAAGLHPLAPLKNLHATYGVFAVAGNHDHGIFRYFDFLHITRKDHADQVVEYLRSLGITVLVNESTDLRVGTDVLSIAGMDDVWSENADIDKTFANAHKPTILMVHNPDVILDPAAKRANLIVTGHTHGGQIRLPWYGSLVRLPIRIGKIYDQGLFAIGTGTTLAITRGLGESGPRARLFAPPEIFLLTVQ